jgi:hypothetical protein
MEDDLQHCSRERINYLVTRLQISAPVICVRLPMKTFFKWAGIVAGATGATVVAYRVLRELRAKASRGLRQAEQVTDEARQAMERTEEALRHTQHAIKDARTVVS